MMEENEQLIWSILRNRKGPEGAITARQICTMLGERFSQVQVRMIIRGLIVNYGLPIASVTTNPGGFFIPVTREQKRHYAQSLKSRIREIAVRLRAYEKAVAEAVLRQLELDLPEQERSEREVLSRRP